MRACAGRSQAAATAASDVAVADPAFAAGEAAVRAGAGRPVSSGRPWTPEDDATARRLRATGLRWRDVGAAIGRDGACCRQRIMRVLREPDPLAAVREAEKAKQPKAPGRLDYGSAPLPPGSPLTWNEMNVGTALDGSGYR